MVTKQTESIDAYGYSLKGKYHFRKWNPEDMRLAISFYEKALELNPNHTESCLGLADCYGFMATTGFLPMEESWGKAALLTNQALQLNDQLPAVHYQLENLSFFIQSNYQESYKLTLRAIALNPNYAEKQQFLSFLYIIAGEKKKAVQHVEIVNNKELTKALIELNECLNDNPN